MHYYVKIEANDRGDHVVHAESCQFLPNEDGRKALGDDANCETAMKHARDEFDPVQGCQTCAPGCHES